MTRMLVAVAVVGALAASVAIACHHSEYERDVLTEQFNEIAEQFTGEAPLQDNNQITEDLQNMQEVVKHNYDYNGDGRVSHSVTTINGVSYLGGDYEVITENIYQDIADMNWGANGDPQDAVNQLAAYKQYVEQRVQDFSNMNLAEWMDPSWAYDADGNIKDTFGANGQPDGVINSDDTWTNYGYKDTLIAQLNKAVETVDLLINDLIAKYGLNPANPGGWQIGDRNEWSGDAPTGQTEPGAAVPTVVPPSTTGTNTAQTAEDK